MTAVRPADFLPRGSGNGAAAALWNAFAAGAGRAHALGSATIRYDFAEAPAPTRPAVLLHLPFWPEPVAVVPEEFPFAGLAGAELVVDDLPTLPPELRRAIHEGILATLQGIIGDAASSIAGAEPLADGALGSLAAASGAPAEWLRLTLIAQTLPEPVAALVRAPRALLVDRFRPPSKETPGPLAGAIELDVDLTLGAIRLSLEAFQALEPGDVVVLADTGIDRVSMRVGEIGFTFRRADAGWICSGPERPDRPAPRSLFPTLAPSTEPERDMMSDLADDPASGAEAPDLAALPLAVDFDLARVALPYSTVAAWTRGSVIELSPPSTDAGIGVTIRVNGEAVGTGDIVRIDDRVAVRITRLLRSRP